METETCTCGRTVALSETTLRLRAQTVGCKGCCFTGREMVRIATAILSVNANPPTKDTTS